MGGRFILRYSQVYDRTPFESLSCQDSKAQPQTWRTAQARKLYEQVDSSGIEAKLPNVWVRVLNLQKRCC